MDIQEALDRYEAEKKEFRKYLFEEKDVPAFLEGISKYAAESAINVVDMKTKKFQEVATAADQKPSRSKYGTRRQGTKTEATPDEKLERALTLAAMPISIKVKGTVVRAAEGGTIGVQFSELDDNTRKGLLDYVMEKGV